MREEHPQFLISLHLLDLSMETPPPSQRSYPVIPGSPSSLGQRDMCRVALLSGPGHGEDSVLTRFLLGFDSCVPKLLLR